MINIRRISFLLAIILVLSLCLPVCAEESSTADVQSEESFDGVALTPGIVSGNAVVAYCIDDNQFLYKDRIDEKYRRVANSRPWRDSLRRT